MMAGKQMGITVAQNGIALRSGRRARSWILGFAALFAPADRVRSRQREARASLETAAARLSEQDGLRRVEPLLGEAPYEGPLSSNHRPSITAPPVLEASGAREAGE